MENSRPQLNLSELTQLRWLLGGVLGLLSAWTVFYMEVDALLALAVLTVTVPVFTLMPRLSVAVPGWVHRLAFPLIVTVFAFDWWQNREPLHAMIRLDLMLIGYRCVAPRGRRDDLQLILLALFAVVVTGVFTVSIAFVVQILLFTACALALLLAITIADARAGDGTEARAGWERVHWGALARRVRAVSDGRVVALGAALFAGVVGLSTVFFLAIPRFEISSSLFLDRMMTRKSLTGFTENVRFGAVTAIQQDDSMAFAVDVDPELVPAEPYWRMIVLDQYAGDGFRMSQALKEEREAPRERSMIHNGPRKGAADGAVWTVFYQPGISRYLPLLGAFNTITFGEAQSLQQSRALRLAALTNESSKLVGYRIEGMDTGGRIPDPGFARRLRDEALNDEALKGAQIAEPEARVAEVAGPRSFNRDEAETGVRQPPPLFLALGLEQPADVTRLAGWVAELGGKGEGGLDLALRTGRWLQERHQYSLSSSIPDGEGDALVRWIGSDQPGHCELFAGGLVMLVRAAGVPARMVTGFKGGAWNQLSGGIRVLNSDAHAWCEVWDEKEEVWLRVDPTPGAVLVEPVVAGGSTPSLARMGEDSGWSARLDGVRIFWYRRVVNFDSASQVGLLKTSKEVVQTRALQTRAWIEARVEELVAWVRAPWDWARFAGLGFAVGLATTLWVLWRIAGMRWWLSWRSRRAGAGRADPVRREAAGWLRRLEAARAVGVRMIPGDALERAQADLLRLRYGDRDSWGEPLQIFDAARRELRAARRARTKAGG
jgi:transglutaminase-like putative cysteine protease